MYVCVYIYIYCIIIIIIVIINITIIIIMIIIIISINNIIISSSSSAHSWFSAWRAMRSSTVVLAWLSFSRTASRSSVVKQYNRLH